MSGAPWIWSAKDAKMDVQIIVALISVLAAVISGAVALYSIRLTASATERTERVKSTMQKEIERLKSDIAEQQQIRAEQRTKREMDKQLLAKYRDPLLRSVFDLRVGSTTS
jgi:septal ring factor EnvC (AmiA/AmiB activator)